jgi:hypothetical protein
MPSRPELVRSSLQRAGDANHKAHISFELSLLLAEQTEYFEKTALVGPTPEEIQQFEYTGQRIRDLFAELERRNKAA